MKESESIQRLKNSIEVEARDLEEFLQPYQKLLQEKRRQVQELESERLEAEKQEFIATNGVTKRKPKTQKSNSEDESSKTEKSLMNKFMSALDGMSPEQQENLLKKYGLK